MWRVGRPGATLLACVLVAGFACPPAMATPEGQPTQTYGQPPVWGGCEQFVGDTSAIPTAQCGTVSVPVDYANPEGAQAQLAVIRIPATGDRIGVLMVNPGGPGASAVDTVAGMGAGLADTEIARRFDLVGFDPAESAIPRPSCAAAPTPNSTPTEGNRTPTTAPRASRTSKICTASSRSGCADRVGKDFLANVGTASTAQGHGRGAGGVGREPDQLPRVLLRHRNRCRRTRRHTPTGSAPWSSTVRSTRAWTRSTRTCAKWPDSKRHSRTTPPTVRSWPDARSAPTLRSSSTATTS